MPRSHSLAFSLLASSVLVLACAAAVCQGQPAPLGTLLYEISLCGHPSSVTLDSGGVLYVAYQNQDLVQAISPTGELLRNWTADSTAGYVTSPTGVAVDEARALLWVVSSTTAIVTQLNWDSIVLRTIGGLFGGNSALLFDSTRQRLVLPNWNQIVSFDPIIGGQTASNTFPYVPIYSVAINNSDGSVYVAMQGMTHIVQLDLHFNYVARVPYPAPRVSTSPVQLARDVAGRFYVTYQDDDAVVVLAADGTVLWRYDGFLFGPTFVAVDPAGARIYVSDFWNQRIVVFAGPNATDPTPTIPVPVPAPTSAPFPHCGPPTGLYDFQGINVSTLSDSISPGPYSWDPSYLQGYLVFAACTTVAGTSNTQLQLNNVAYGAQPQTWDISYPTTHTQWTVLNNGRKVRMSQPNAVFDRTCSTTDGALGVYYTATIDFVCDVTALGAGKFGSYSFTGKEYNSQLINNPGVSPCDPITLNIKTAIACFNGNPVPPCSASAYQANYSYVTPLLAVDPNNEAVLDWTTGVDAMIDSNDFTAWQPTATTTLQTFYVQFLLPQLVNVTGITLVLDGSVTATPNIFTVSDGAVNDSSAAIETFYMVPSCIPHNGLVTFLLNTTLLTDEVTLSFFVGDTTTLAVYTVEFLTNDTYTGVQRPSTFDSPIIGAGNCSALPPVFLPIMPVNVTVGSVLKSFTLFDGSATDVALDDNERLYVAEPTGVSIYAVVSGHRIMQIQPTLTGEPLDGFGTSRSTQLHSAHVASHRQCHSIPAQLHHHFTV